MAEFTCNEFRAKRDYFIWLRRVESWDALKTRQTALWKEITVLVRQRDAATKHNKQLFENNLLPLGWAYQEIAGQLAVIESDYAAILKANGGAVPEWFPKLAEVTAA